jgi:competence protein CoiA
MLTASRGSDGQKVAAWEAERRDAPFVCFCCRQTVRLKKGEIKAPHFAHVPPVTCEYGTGESEAHRLCKIALYENLLRDQRVRKCEMERDLGTVRPDVSAYINDVPVAIEVQLSNLSIAKIQYRTHEYARKGIYVLWLPLYTTALKQRLYSPRPWERWLHTVYFGRVYYWLEGLKIVPVRFRDYYYTARGRTKDYQKLSRKIVPLDDEPLLLTQDFVPVKREVRSRNHLAIARANLFTGNYEPRSTSSINSRGGAINLPSRLTKMPSE